MSFNNGPRTVTTGLSLLVDAADPLSYPGSGTSWTDIVTGITGSLSGSITYASDFKGTLVVNNSSSVIIFPTSSANFGENSFTVELAFQPNQINGQHWLVAKNSGSFPSWGAFITGSGGSGRVTAFFNISSTISCSMSTPTGSIVTGSNYLVDINFAPNTILNTIYLNSELSGSVTPNGTGSLSTTSSLFISNRNSGSSVGSPLEIFNAKLYTPRLVPGRIRQNYNALSTRLGLPQKSFLSIIEDQLLNLYPGAAAAYSLRLLDSSYAGSAIRVRRSSDNAEQDIGFINNTLDTTSLLSFVGAGNGFVTTWYDQSGNANNATQSLALNQPQIVSSGSVLTTNGKPSVRFDGSNDHLFLNAALFSGAGSRTILSVYKPNNSTGSFIYTIFGQTFNGSNGGYTAIQSRTDSVTGDPYFAGFGQDLGNGLTTPNTSQKLAQFNYDGITGYLYKNNTSVQSANITLNAQSTGLVYIGVANFSGTLTEYSRSDIQECIAWTSNQNSNTAGISTNINSYYQIY